MSPIVTLPAPSRRPALNTATPLLGGRRSPGLCLGVFLSVLALLTAVCPPALAASAGSGAASRAAGASSAHKGIGTVVAWGDNGFGQLTAPAGLKDLTAISAGYQHSLALKSDGTAAGWGDNTYGQATVPSGLSGVAAISAGGFHSLALTSDGSLVTGWGDNADGQTSVPAGVSGVVAVAAGYSHSLALKSDGTVVAWGGNSNGQTDVPVGLSGVTAVAAGGLHSLAVKSDGTVVAWGYNNYGETSVPPGLTGVVAVAAGEYHSLALKSDGTVVAWGYDGSGQADVPSGLPGVVAVAAGQYYSLAIRFEADTLAAQGVDVAATAGAAFTGPVATFTDTNAATPASAFSASIDWGDGTTSAGTVTGSGSSFSVAGAHTYAVVGSDTITTTVIGPGGPLSPTSTAAVGQATPSLAVSLTTGSNPSAYGDSLTFTAALTGGAGPTGSVTFTVDGTAQAPVALTNGSAVFSTSSLSVSSHTLTVTYNGDTNNATSDTTASPLTQTVNPAASTTALTSSLNPSRSGQSVTFTASVTGQSPTGTVTFTLDGIAGSPVALSSGSASYATSSLSVGGHSVTAAYGGDTDNAGSTSSPALTQTVYKAATNTTLASSLSPSFAGQSVTFTAAVTGNAPAGIITFYDGATPLGTGTLSGGVATLSASALSAGSHVITAKYGGDVSNAASAAALTQRVTNTVVTVTNVSGVYGQSATLSASLNGVGAIALPGRTLTFSVDGTPVGTAKTDGTSVATLPVTLGTAYAPGSHCVTAAFGGDAAGALPFHALSWGTGTLSVLQAGSSLTVPGVPGAYGQTVTLVARLTRTPDHAPLPGMTLSFSIDGVSGGKGNTAVTDGNGTARLCFVVPDGLALGGHRVTVSFAGSCGSLASSGAGMLSILRANVSLVVPASCGARGGAATLTGTLTRATDGMPLVGRTITFTVGGTAAGTAVTNVCGVASRSYTVPAGSPAGSRSVGANYAGDETTLAGTGSGTLTVY